MRRKICPQCKKAFYTNNHTRQRCLRCKSGYTKSGIGPVRLVCRWCRGPLENAAWAQRPGDDLPSLVCGKCAKTR